MAPAKIAVAPLRRTNDDQRRTAAIVLPQDESEHPDLVGAYESFGAACAQSGPLDTRTVALVKLAISLGAGLEGAVHSHVRKAIEAGWGREELLHAAHLCGPTIGFPSMMRARGWVLDVVDGKRNQK